MWGLPFHISTRTTFLFKVSKILSQEINSKVLIYLPFLPKSLRNGDPERQINTHFSTVSFQPPRQCKVVFLIIILSHYSLYISIAYVSEVRTWRVKNGNPKWMVPFVLWSIISLQPAPWAEPHSTHINSPFNHYCGLMTLGNSQPDMPNIQLDNHFGCIFHEQKLCSCLLTNKSA